MTTRPLMDSTNKGSNQQIGRNEKIERLLSKSLRIALKTRGLYETKDGNQKRVDMLHRLQTWLNEWSGKSEAIGVKSSKENNVLLFTFGSYRLDVHRPGADVDVLVLAPSHCSRESFFSDLVQLLEKDELITNLHPIPSAYTPVIKMKISSISIDLVFARCGGSMLDILRSEDEVDSSENIFKPCIEESHLAELELDEVGMRSVNGVRVNQIILDIVDKSRNTESFRHALICIKEWATVHGIYSNVLGFLGGVNWALLISYICRLYPNSDPSTLLCNFFKIFSEWDWPKPVTLVPTRHHPPKGVIRQTYWNPKTNRRDGMHLMPILTPAYPSMNSAYNVGHPQIRRLRTEFWRARNLSDSIRRGKSNWTQLFKGSDFFKLYQHFIEVSISSTSDSRFRKWFGMCEARLRILIASLDNSELGIEAHPFSKIYFVPNLTDKREAKFYIALKFVHEVKQVDVTGLSSEFLYMVNSWEGRTQDMDLGIVHKTRESLPGYLFSEEQFISKKSGVVDKKKRKNEENCVGGNLNKSPRKAM